MLFLFENFKAVVFGSIVIRDKIQPTGSGSGFPGMGRFHSIPNSYECFINSTKRDVTKFFLPFNRFSIGVRALATFVRLVLRGLVN